MLPAAMKHSLASFKECLASLMNLCTTLLQKNANCRQTSSWLCIAAVHTWIRCMHALRIASSSKSVTSVSTLFSRVYPCRSFAEDAECTSSSTSAGTSAHSAVIAFGTCINIDKLGTDANVFAAGVLSHQARQRVLLRQKKSKWD